jgi:hypothetical protein
MQDETRTETTTETSKVEQDSVEINSATPEVEIPVQPATETTEVRTETTTTQE